MPIHFRKRPAIGPFRLNITERGIRSVAIKFGPFTWNLTRRRGTVDGPGGLRYETRSGR